MSFLTALLVLAAWVVGGGLIALLFMAGWIRFAERRDRRPGFVDLREVERLRRSRGGRL